MLEIFHSVSIPFSVYSDQERPLVAIKQQLKKETFFIIFYFCWKSTSENKFC